MSTDCDKAIVQNSLTCSSRKDNVPGILLQCALTVFEDTRSTLLNSVSNFLALTTSVASLKSDAICRAHVVQRFNRSQCVPEPSTYGVIQ
jgi:hypothetical protein